MYELREDSSAQDTSEAVTTETGQAAPGAPGLAPATTEPANCLTLRRAVPTGPGGLGGLPVADPTASAQSGPGPAAVSAPFDPEAPAGGKARRKENREPRQGTSMEHKQATEPTDTKETGKGEDDGSSRAKTVKVMKQSDVPPQ